MHTSHAIHRAGKGEMGMESAPSNTTKRELVAKGVYVSSRIEQSKCVCFDGLWYTTTNINH